jgi:hypothetical protein
MPNVQLRMLIVFAAMTACGGHRSQKGGDAAKAAAAPKPPAAETVRKRVTGGSGVPSGFVGYTDDAHRKLEDVKYRSLSSGWEITTGPAHIMYAVGDTMRGEFIVASTFNQMEATAKPEAFGLFIGGQDMGQPSRRYTYFMVRSNGEYAVKVREGTETRDIIAWTLPRVAARPMEEGRTRYRLAIQVRGDSVRFLRNGAPIATMKTGAVLTDGVAGIRLDDNVHVAVDRLRSTN